MKLVILAVGKGRTASEHELALGFMKRLPAGGDIIEIESKLPAGPKRLQDESQLLMRHVSDNAILVALDPKGKDTSSEALANKLAAWRDAGHASVFFAIGGADGHDAALRQRANDVISFGSATWPHMLFRAMLAEQLYRATSILAGHPYHRAG